MNNLIFNTTEYIWEERGENMQERSISLHYKSPRNYPNGVYDYYFLGSAEGGANGRPVFFYLLFFFNYFRPWGPSFSPLHPGYPGLFIARLILLVYQQKSNYSECLRVDFLGRLVSNMSIAPLLSQLSRSAHAVIVKTIKCP